MRGYQIIDVSLTPGDKTTGHIVPIVGIEGGTQVDYDTETKSLYWVEGLKVNEEDETVDSVNVSTTLYMSSVPSDVGSIRYDNYVVGLVHANDVSVSRRKQIVIVGRTHRFRGRAVRHRFRLERSELVHRQSGIVQLRSNQSGRYEQIQNGIVIEQRQRRVGGDAHRHRLGS